MGANPVIRGGPGNDQITVSPAEPQDLPSMGYYMIVYGDDGNDRITTANGLTDQVHCGLGNDIWINDPFDEPIYPAEETGCETAGPTLRDSGG